MIKYHREQHVNSFDDVLCHVSRYIHVDGNLKSENANYMYLHPDTATTCLYIYTMHNTRTHHNKNSIICDEKSCIISGIGVRYNFGSFRDDTIEAYTSKIFIYINIYIYIYLCIYIPVAAKVY